jgi:hypothetical protein
LKYYTQNIPIEKTINECGDVKLFCFTTKTGKTYNKTYYMINSKLYEANKVNRVVATTNQTFGTIYKYKPENEVLQQPNPFAKDYVQQQKEYNRKLKKRQQFTDEYGIPFGRLDKAAEIPEHARLLNDDLYMPEDLDRN